MSNCKYDEPRFVNGKRTRAGNDAENARRREARNPTRRKPGGPKPPTPSQPISLEDFIQRVPVVNPYWSEQDVAAWINYFHQKTGRQPEFNVGHVRAIESFRLVPTQRLREAFVKRMDDPVFYSLLAHELKAARKVHGDFGPLSREHWRLAYYCRRALGVESFTADGCAKVQLLVSYEIAEAICKSLGLRPYDVGV